MLALRVRVGVWRPDGGSVVAAAVRPARRKGELRKYSIAADRPLQQQQQQDEAGAPGVVKQGPGPILVAYESSREAQHALQWCLNHLAMPGEWQQGGSTQLHGC